MRGRPSAYTEALAEEICRRIAGGETLKQICRETDGVPPESTVREWVLDDREGFSARYARARDLQLESWAEEIQDIGDDGRNDWIERERKDGSTFIALNTEAVMRSTLRVNNRKWLLSKLKPERYGDSLKLTGELDLNIKTDEQLTDRLTQLFSEKGSDSDPGGAGAT